MYLMHLLTGIGIVQSVVFVWHVCMALFVVSPPPNTLFYTVSVTMFLGFIVYFTHSVVALHDNQLSIT